MSRRRTALVALAIATGLTVAPASAATKPKPKPKPISGSYTLSLMPDPTTEIGGQIAKSGCTGLLPSGKDEHALQVPAAGKLYIHLVSPDPTGRGQTDWDLWLKDGSGAYIGSSHDGTSDEEITIKLKKKTATTIEVCNLIGTPSATVSYVFTYA